MTEILWGSLITVYPFFSGIAAGAYIVSILPVLFKREELKEFSLLALLIAWATLITAPIPLVFHLGSPWRAGNIFIFPQSTSPMALFGYLWIIFLIISTTTIIIYNWFSNTAWFRSTVTALSVIGIVISILFSGYVGFIFGSTKSKELWYTPIVPISFVLSAIVSGAALVGLLYILIWRISRLRIDIQALNSLRKIIWWTLLLDVVFVSSEFIVKTYHPAAVWRPLSELFFRHLGLSYLGIQLIIGGIIPLIVLLFKKSISSPSIMSLMSILILAGVFAYRWNLIIGGQLVIEASPYVYTTISYVVGLLGEGGILWITSIFLVWAFLLSLALVIFPRWKVEVKLHD